VLPARPFGVHPPDPIGFRLVVSAITDRCPNTPKSPRASVPTASLEESNPGDGSDDSSGSVEAGERKEQQVRTIAMISCLIVQLEVSLTKGKGENFAQLSPDRWKW